MRQRTGRSTISRCPSIWRDSQGIKTQIGKQFRKCHVLKPGDVPRHHIPHTGLSSNLWSESWMRAPEGQKWEQSMLPFLSYLHPMLFDEAWCPGIWNNPEECPDPKNLHDAMMLSVNVDIRRQLPAEGADWVYCRSSCRAVVNGKQDIGQVLLDESGQLLAVSQNSLHFTNMETYLSRAREHNAHSKM